VKFAGNNMFQNEACAYDLLGNAYGGGVIENHLQSANGSWAEQLETTFSAMVNNWPADLLGPRGLRVPAAASRPTSDPPGTTLYRRDFANGIVLVNGGALHRPTRWAAPTTTS
jgi:hypothetical protein